MMLLYEIGESGIEPAVTPVGLKKMAEIFASADVYVAYRWDRTRLFGGRQGTERAQS